MPGVCRRVRIEIDAWWTRIMRTPNSKVKNAQSRDFRRLRIASNRRLGIHEFEDSTIRVFFTLVSACFASF